MKESEILYKGGIIIYPTDTIWGIGCDALNINAVEKLKAIKGRDNSKSLILLVKDLKMLSNYVEQIPQCAIDLINHAIEPTTIIYNNPKNLPIEHLSFNNSIGIRIPDNEYLSKLFDEFPYPIVSTSANFSGQPSPHGFTDIDTDLLKSVDYVSDYNRDAITSGSGSSIYIIQTDNSLKKIR